MATLLSALPTMYFRDNPFQMVPYLAVPRSRRCRHFFGPWAHHDRFLVRAHCKKTESNNKGSVWPHQHDQKYHDQAQTTKVRDHLEALKKGEATNETDEVKKGIKESTNNMLSRNRFSELQTRLPDTQAQPFSTIAPTTYPYINDWSLLPLASAPAMPHTSAYDVSMFGDLSLTPSSWASVPVQDGFANNAQLTSFHGADLDRMNLSSNANEDLEPSLRSAFKLYAAAVRESSITPMPDLIHDTNSSPSLSNTATAQNQEDFLTESGQNELREPRPTPTEELQPFSDFSEILGTVGGAGGWVSQHGLDLDGPFSRSTLCFPDSSARGQPAQTALHLEQTGSSHDGSKCPEQTAILEMEDTCGTKIPQTDAGTQALDGAGAGTEAVFFSRTEYPALSPYLAQAPQTEDWQDRNIVRYPSLDPEEQQSSQNAFPLLEPDTDLDFWQRFPSAEPTAPEVSMTFESSPSRCTEKDRLLVQWKRAGMSYKEIKVRGQFGEAESTLRGRFRTLTKRKHERVRKPAWSPREIQLLCQAVSLYLGNPHGSRNGRMAKIPWKNVADYIHQHGGYRFGNATVKKKWVEQVSLVWQTSGGHLA